MGWPLYPAILTIVLTVLFVVACAGSSAGSDQTATLPSPVWYEGGTLHTSTVIEWKSATPADRLATAADWVAALTTYENMGEARVMAEELVSCVNRSARTAPDVMRTSELARICAIVMGWELKEQRP